MNQIYQQVWINLDKQTRDWLRRVFSLTPTGVTEVRDQTVIHDGYTNDDLKGITLEKMNEYIGSEESSFARAWEITLAKTRAHFNPPVGTIGKVHNDDNLIIDEEVKPHGKKANKN